MCNRRGDSPLPEAVTQLTGWGRAVATAVYWLTWPINATTDGCSLAVPHGDNCYQYLGPGSGGRCKVAPFGSSPKCNAQDRFVCIMEASFQVTSKPTTAIEGQF